MKKYPILIIIPHGGYQVPEELAGHESISDFDLFFQADTCANDLFSFGEKVIATVDTPISRFFVDQDRSYQDISQTSPDGVIKNSTLMGKSTFQSSSFPDEIAISNILKRYYFTFHTTIKKIIETNEIKCILDCHTAMPVGPKISYDHGRARPLVTVENSFIKGEKDIVTCKEESAKELLENLYKALADEEMTIADTYTPSSAPPRSYIIRKYGIKNIPLVRLSISKSLYLNDTYFSYDYLRVDDLRIKDLSKTIWSVIKKWYDKFLR